MGWHSPVLGQPLLSNRQWGNVQHSGFYCLSTISSFLFTIKTIVFTGWQERERKMGHLASSPPCSIDRNLFHFHDTRTPLHSRGAAQRLPNAHQTFFYVQKQHFLAAGTTDWHKTCQHENVWLEVGENGVNKKRYITSLLILWCVFF